MWFDLNILLVPYWTGSADSLTTWREWQQNASEIPRHLAIMLPSVNLFLRDLGYLLKAYRWKTFLRILSSMKQTNKQVYQPHRDFCNRKSVLEHLQHEVRRWLATKSRGQLEERQDSCLDTPQHRCIIRKTNNGRVRYYIPVLGWFLYCLLVFYFFPSVWKNLTKSFWVQLYLQTKAVVRVCLHCNYCVT